jgi:glycosyltransferase involved in cell wall biosynthesis
VPSQCFSRTVAHLEDPQSLRYQRLAFLLTQSLWQKIWYLILAKSMRRYEKKVLPKIGLALLLSYSDMLDIQKEIPAARFGRVTYGIDSKTNIETPLKKERTLPIVYSGNMFHPANVDGALFFLNEIFPLILRKQPNTCLYIVGASPDQRIYRAAEQYGQAVVVTGEVSDIACYVRGAQVSVCPVRLAIGVQTKILEAMSWGTPVVSTSAGNSGLAGENGKHLYVEDSPDKFAKKVCDLLAGGSWEMLSANGKKFVEENFSWDRSTMTLATYVHQIAQKDE